MKLAYLQQGFGTELPLILLHPYPLNSRLWCHQLARVSRNRHVIAPDFRGYGRSRPEPQEGFTIEQFASDIRKTLKGAQVPKAVFAGCSMGGYVLFELWRQDPSLIAAMMFIDSKADPDDDAARAKRLEAIDTVRETGTAKLPEVVAGMMSEETRTNKLDVVRDVSTWATEPSCETIIRSIEMLMNRPDSVPTLATIDVPTLVLVGEHDKVTPLEVAQTIHDGVEDSVLKVIPGAGHLSPIENPEAVNREMSAFLAEGVMA